MDPRVTLAVLLAVPVALSGCIGQSADPTGTASIPGAPVSLDELTGPIYDTILRAEATISGADDTRIWLDVFRPETPADVTVPVILVMTPYQSLGDALAVAPGGGEQCAGDLPQECPYEPWLVEFYGPRGYAVAFADVRGNHNAGGCIDQTGPKQWEDGVRVIEWLAEQDWSSGDVGMIGVSYDGETQQSTALLAPPALKTIVPVASVAGQYDYIYYEGVPYEMQGVGTMGGYLAISAVPGQDPGALPEYYERLECQPENMQAAADLSGDMTEYWKEREYRLLADQVTTSVLDIHGLQDWNVKPIHIDGWYNDLVNAEHKRAIYGQWGHQYPDRDDWFGEAGILHRWFDHFLQGIDTGILDELPPVLIEDTDGQWRGIDSFPPLAQDRTSLHLTADGSLAKTPGPAGEATVQDAPRDMAAGAGVMGTDVETAWRTADHQLELVFESAPLEEALHLTGRPTLVFNASTDAESTHWVAILEVVGPDGEASWINRGYQDTRHLAGTDAPAPITPGEPYQVTLRMFPQDDVVPAGSQLRLTLTNDDNWVHQDTTYATSVVQLGEGGAVLELPLDPGGVPYPEAELVRYGPATA